MPVFRDPKFYFMTMLGIAGWTYVAVGAECRSSHAIICNPQTTKCQSVKPGGKREIVRYRYKESRP